MSDLTAFTFYKEDASMAVTLELSSPILNSGSLKINRNGTAGRWVNGVRVNAPLGFTSGRARFLLGAKTALQTNDAIGFVFQQSQADLTLGAGSAYGFFTQVLSSGAGTWRPFLRKFTAGLGTGTTLATGTDYTAAVGTMRAVEVQWILDVANLGGIQLTVKMGSLSTFADLAVDAALNIIVTSSILTTSVGEGPYYVGIATSSGFYLYDHIECVPLLVG